MKRFCKLGVAISVLAFLLTSCLGDNETTSTRNNDFVYITSADGLKYAYSSTDGVVFTSEAVRNAASGKCYFASYKLNSGDMYSSNIFNAQNLSLSSPIDQSDPIVFSAPVIPDNEVFLNSLSIINFIPNNGLGDNWLLSVSANYNDLRAYLYYDSSKQFTDPANPVSSAVGTNKIIIDILFGQSTTSTQKDVFSDYNQVADLERVRSGVSNLLNGDGNSVISYTTSGTLSYAQVQIIFRYKKNSTTETSGYKDTYIPSASGSSSYIMYLYKS